MDREIEFRGKRVDNGEWVEGYLDNRHTTSRILASRRCPTLDTVTFPSYLVIPETVGQFTGLTDKNGVKIFEGDKYLYITGETGVINFDNGCFNCDCVDNIFTLCSMNHDLEITGNIHDEANNV